MTLPALTLHMPKKNRRKAPGLFPAKLDSAWGAGDKRDVIRVALGLQEQQAHALECKKLLGMKPRDSIVLNSSRDEMSACPPVDEWGTVDPYSPGSGAAI
jgi:hypothetical protein